MSSAVAVAAGATYESDLVSASDTAIYSKIISGEGSFVKSGAGDLTFDQVHTYTGSTSISGGTLKTSGSGSLGSSTALSVASGATYEVGADEEVGSIAAVSYTHLTLPTTSPV